MSTNVVTIDNTPLETQLKKEKVEHVKYVFINGYRITQQEYDCAATIGPWFEYYSQKQR